MAPAAIEFWYLLGESDGADPTRALDTGSDPAAIREWAQSAEAGSKQEKGRDRG